MDVRRKEASRGAWGRDVEREGGDRRGFGRRECMMGGREGDGTGGRGEERTQADQDVGDNERREYALLK